MASGAQIAGLSVLALLALAGCAENPMMLSGQVQQYQKEQVAMNRQYQQLQDRARTLDQANQDLSRRLALADQQTQLADEQTPRGARSASHAERPIGRLADRAAQQRAEVAGPQRLAAPADGRVDHPQQQLLADVADPFAAGRPRASRRRHDPHRVARRSGCSIPAGRSCAGAAGLIAEVATELRRNYPDQVIGVEGHTDSDPLPGGQWRSNHQLSIVQAMAVYEELTQPDGAAAGAAPGGWPRFEPSGGLQRHSRGKAAQSPRGAGRLPGPLAIAAGGAGHAAG